MIKKFLLSIEEHTVGWFVSTIFNIGYWIKHINEWELAKGKMNSLEEKIESIDDTKHFMGNFKWQSERFDWTPWVITAVHKYMAGTYDDCDGAAVLWKYLFEVCGHKANIWHLRGDSGHAVAVTENGRYMGTNSILYEFRDTDIWKEELLNEYFDNKYEFMFKG